ncbi:MAG: NAD(P)/FAD-dependent oxidoreductase [Vicinamibacterales bacterium]
MFAGEAGVDVDVLVVGAGPGGLFTADRFARAGHRVLVCEEHETIGEPVHCTGIVAADSFDEFDLPRDTVLNGLTRVTFVSPSLMPIGYTTPKPEAVVIDRGRFDRALADRARRAGADVRTGARVTDLEIDDHGVRARAGGVGVRARLVVLACGAAYRAQRRIGLGLPGSFLHTAQREMPAARLGDVEVHFGQDVAPAGFAWAVPVERPSGPHVRVGVMTSHDAPRYFQHMLARVSVRWGVQADAVAPRLKILPLGAIGRTYGTRLLVVGDAAGLVKPTTGGGIYYSILSAALAAETGARALSRNRLDAESLAPYQSAWRARLAREFDAQHALRRAAVAMTDTDIDKLFDLARTDGVMPLVRKTARFNEHRHLIRALFKHPPARRILFRALVA